MAGKDGFLRRVFTRACLKRERNTPELSHESIILVIETINVWRQESSTNLGIGSSSQILLGDDKISLET